MFELIILIIVIWYFRSTISNKINDYQDNYNDLNNDNSSNKSYSSSSDSSAVDRIKSNPDINNYSNKIKEDYILNYDNIFYEGSPLKLSGNSAMIKSIDEESYFIFMSEGKHQISDKKYIIDYSIFPHYDSNGQKKLYFSNINVNNIPVEGKLTNKNTAVSILEDISKITKEAIFTEDESEVGDRFFVECAAILVFNEINWNRSLRDYVNMPNIVRDKFIQNAREKLDVYINSIEDSLFKNSNYDNSYNSNEQNFDIYLKVMEFKSVNGVTYDDLKIQYKKLAKKYHPDTNTGDANRFKLVVEAYEYLQENYPR